MFFFLQRLVFLCGHLFSYATNNLMVTLGLTCPQVYYIYGVGAFLSFVVFKGSICPILVEHGYLTLEQIEGTILDYTAFQSKPGRGPDYSHRWRPSPDYSIYKGSFEIKQPTIEEDNLEVLTSNSGGYSNGHIVVSSIVGFTFGFLVTLLLKH